MLRRASGANHDAIAGDYVGFPARYQRPTVDSSISKQNGRA
jgi:hypothetical protein